MADRQNALSPKEEARAREEEALIKKVNDKLFNLEKADRNAAAFLRKTLESTGGYQRYGKKIVGATNEQLGALAQAARKYQQAANKAGQLGHLEHLKQGFAKLTPASAVEGAYNGVVGGAKLGRAGFNAVGRKAPDALIAMVIGPNIFAAILGPVGPFIFMALATAYVGQRLINMIDDKLDKRASETTKCDDSERTDRSLRQAFAEIFGSKPKPDDDPDDARDIEIAAGGVPPRGERLSPA